MGAAESTQEPADDPVISYGATIARHAQRHPEDVALTVVALDGSERTLTWAELDGRANQIARAIATRGAGAGDRVAIALQNSPELVASIVAAWKLGAVPIPVRWDLPDWERRRLLDVIDAELDIQAHDLDWLQASARESAEPLPDAVPPQTHGICSSGSTGTPKVILIDKPGLYDHAATPPFPSGWIVVPRPQVVLVPAPMYHTNGFAPLTALLGGDQLVVMEKFDAALVVDLIERRRVTTFTATPTMLQRIADLPGVDGRDFSSIVWILQGGAVIPPSLVRRWIDLVGGAKFFMAYGMTEGLGLTALHGDEWLLHPGSVGRGYRDTELRILDDAGTQLPPGEIGEIYLRWPAGGLYNYLGKAGRLATTADGFGSAGDIGWVDDDGYLFIADRRVDMIITGGANVFPAEVESALIEHPEIADVVVVGLADPEWGRRVHAIIEPSHGSGGPTADEVIAFAKTRLAAYKVPKTVELIDRIPRSEATKVSRAVLVDERGG